MKRKQKKSSIQKGNEFEDRVFLIFSKLLSDDKLFMRSEGSTIYQKKGYYSKDRQNNIVVDISIETFIKDASNYSILTVIECKDYKKLIPIDDIEEFKAKLDQIAGKNVKGIMVSRHGFSERTMNYAKSQGIALVRLLDGNKINWDINRAIHTTIKTKEKIDIFNDEIHKGLINNIIYSLNSNYCFCNHYNHYYNSLSDLLLNLGINNNGDNAFIEYFVKRNFINIPFIKREEIEGMANKILLMINKTDAFENSLDRIVEHIKRKYKVKISEISDLGMDRNGNKILARFNPCRMTVEIYNGLDEHRKRFTIAHEIGHIILHRSYLINPVSEIDLSINIFNDYILDKDTGKRAEIQANIFAAYLLMPRKIFLAKAIEIAVSLDYKKKGDYLIYIDEQPCNLNNYIILARQLSFIFNVSKQAIEYHLKSFEGLLKDDRKYNWEYN
jgi:Zn-dependent peptidase ImmA (M78 family)